MNKEILDLDEAIDFHHNEIDKLFDEDFLKSTNDELPVFTISNHYTMLAWLFRMVNQEATTSFTEYCNRCKEISIPHYNNEI